MTVYFCPIFYIQDYTINIYKTWEIYMSKKTFSNFSEETSLILYGGYYYCLKV